MAEMNIVRSQSRVAVMAAVVVVVVREGAGTDRRSGGDSEMGG